MPKKLLLADDSVTIQKVVQIALAREDVAITTVDNGEDAIARARELRPDLVVADAVMPKKTGYEVCEALKGDPDLRSIPVLLLAGTFEAFDEGRARAAGADSHIQKPFESQALIDRVNQLLYGAAAPARPAAPRPGAPAAAPAPAPAVARPPMPGIPAPGPRPIPTPPVAPRPVAAPGTRPMPPMPGAPGPAASAQRPNVFGPSLTAQPMPRPQGLPAAAAPAAASPLGPFGSSRAPGPGSAVPGLGPPGPAGAPGPIRTFAPLPGVRPAAPPPPTPARPTGPASPQTTPLGPAPFGPSRAPPAGMPGFASSPVVPRPAAAPFAALPTRPAAAPPRPARDPFGLDLGKPAAPEASPSATLPYAALAPASPMAAPPAAAPAPIPSNGGAELETRLRQALSQASRELIERIAWEVVPQLAETIIREELDRLVKNRGQG